MVWESIDQKLPPSNGKYQIKYRGDVDLNCLIMGKGEYENGKWIIPYSQLAYNMLAKIQSPLKKLIVTHWRSDDENSSNL